MFLSELSFCSQVCKQFAASNVRHQEVQVTTVLGESFETDLYCWFSGVTYKERVIDIGQNCVFRDDMIYLPQLYDICLLQSLHCRVLTSLFVLCKHYPAERP